MVNISASIGIKAGMDMSEVERGKEKITSLFDETKRKGKETNVFLERSTGLIKGLTKASAAFGVGLLASLTGVVAMSPQFKVMFERLKPILYDLGMYMGGKLQPLFDGMVDSAGNFVSKFKELDEKHNILGKIAEGGNNLLSSLEGIASEGTLDKIIGMVSKTIEITTNFLFGGDENTGLIGILGELGKTAGGIISKTLELSINTIGLDNTTKAAMIGAAMLIGNAPIAVALTAAFGFQHVEKAAKGYVEGQKELGDIIETHGGIKGFMQSDMPGDVKGAAYSLYYVDQAARAIAGVIEYLLNPKKFSVVNNPDVCPGPYGKNKVTVDFGDIPIV